MKIYKTAALDPNAYSYEENPARLQKDMDTVPFYMGGKVTKIRQKQDPEALKSNYFGVHFTPEEKTAAIYACGKATAEDPPVIIQLSPQEMKQKMDVDATIDMRLGYYLDEKRNDWMAILNSSQDDDEKSMAIYEEMDADAMNWQDETEVNGADDAVMRETSSCPPVVISNYLSGVDPTPYLQSIKDILSGNIPEELHVRMIGQFRTMHPVGEDRVKAIYQIPWVDFSQEPRAVNHEATEEELEEEGFHRENEYTIKNEKGQIVLSYDDLDYGNWMSREYLYQNKKQFLPGFEMSEDSVYHGTSLSRAKQAYPELLGRVATANSRLAKKVSHHYSWVYLDLPEEACALMKAFTHQIDPDDLFVEEGDGGKETDFHVTVKYGLNTDEVKEIKERLDEEKGGKVHLGSSSIFEADEYDVVKIDVKSDALNKLHAKLNELPHEDKHPDYHAHATIAYVKSGKGKKYVGKFKVNQDFKFKEVYFGDRDKKNHKISLAGSLHWYSKITQMHMSDKGIFAKTQNNWYRFAQVQNGEEKPYMLCIVYQDGGNHKEDKYREITHSLVHGKREYAVSEGEAKKLFSMKYPLVKEWFNNRKDIVPRVDTELIKKIQQKEQDKIDGAQQQFSRDWED